MLRQLKYYNEDVGAEEQKQMDKIVIGNQFD